MWTSLFGNILWGKLKSTNSADIFADFDTPNDDQVVDICREPKVEHDDDVSFEAIKHFALINRLFIDIYYYVSHEPRIVQAIDAFASTYDGKPISATYKFMMCTSDYDPWKLDFEEESDQGYELCGEISLRVTLADQTIKYDLQCSDAEEYFEGFSQGRNRCNAVYLRDLFYHIRENGRFAFYCV